MNLCIFYYYNTIINNLEQAIRLMYLEKYINEMYRSDETRKRLTFESAHHLIEGLACVVWQNTEQVIFTSTILSST